MVMCNVRRGTIFLKGRQFDVSFSSDGDRVVIHSVEKHGEDFKDILSDKAILAVRESLEYVYREDGANGPS